jgi:peptidoglycan/LPS O-acetylase OafA/YrhL
MRDEDSSQKDRIFFLDVLKAISIIAVVLFHASSNLSESTKYQLDILLSPFRFCVPVLLTISLVLLNRSLEINYEDSNWLIFRKRFVRLLLPLSFWFSVASILTLSLNVTSDKDLHLKDVVFLNLQGQVF